MKKSLYKVTLLFPFLLFSACTTTSAEQNYLKGLAFRNGITERFDLERSFSYLDKAARKNHTEAQCLVADAYHRGSGAQQSYNKAVDYYKLCIKKKDFYTFMTLGYIHFEDLSNPLIALSWYYTAEYYGDDSQKKSAQELQKKMEYLLTTEEILFARTMSNNTIKDLTEQ